MQSTNPVLFGAENGARVEKQRFNQTSARSHGLTFTDDSANGQIAYRDLAQIIRQVLETTDIDVFILDPSNKFDQIEPFVSTSTHELSLETLGNPLKFPFVEGFQDSFKFGMQTIQSLLLTAIGINGGSFTHSQEELFFHLVKQAYTNLEGARRPLDTLFTDDPTLADLSAELIPLCRQSSQTEINGLVQILSEFQATGKYQSLGDLEGELTVGDASIQRYTLEWDPMENNIQPALLYQTVLTSMMAKAHLNDGQTWVVLSDYETLLTEGTSQRVLERALQIASGANTVYDMVIKNVTNQRTLPPIQNWYNQGMYTRYYTADAPPTLGAIPSEHNQWFNHSKPDRQSHSLLALSEHGEDPHRLETAQIV